MTCRIGGIEIGMPLNIGTGVRAFCNCTTHALVRPRSPGLYPLKWPHGCLETRRLPRPPSTQDYIRPVRGQLLVDAVGWVAEDISSTHKVRTDDSELTRELISEIDMTWRRAMLRSLFVLRIETPSRTWAVAMLARRRTRRIMDDDPSMSVSDQNDLQGKYGIG